jgi:hypothetical protein
MRNHTDTDVCNKCWYYKNGHCNCRISMIKRYDKFGVVDHCSEYSYDWDSMKKDEVKNIVVNFIYSK